MSTVVDFRRTISTAKGNVTRAANSIANLKDLPHSSLDSNQIKRIRENLNRAEELFSSNHQAILETTISDSDTSLLQAEEVLAEEFDRTLMKQFGFLQILQDQNNSFHLLQRVETQLEGYEDLEFEDIESILPRDLPKLELLFEEFVDSMSTPGARECSELKHHSKDLRRRIAHLQRSLPVPSTDLRSSASTTLTTASSAF